MSTVISVANFGGFFLNNIVDNDSEEEMRKLREDTCECTDIDGAIEFFSKSKRNCIKGYDGDIVPKYSEREFIMHFRINKALFNSLSELFSRDSSYRRLQSNGRLLIPELHILIFLWFSGHECASFRDIANCFDITITQADVRIYFRVDGAT